jgi:sugar phosphate isomerase/epimerase
MKLGFTTLGCPEWKLEEVARNARAYGFDGVELRVADDKIHLSPDASAGDLARVAGVFREAGVPVYALAGYATFASLQAEKIQGNQKLARKLLAVAAALGARFVRVYGGRGEKTRSRAEAAASIAAALEPVAREAADRGVTFAIETHDDWCAGDDVMRIIESVGGPGVGVLFDIHNTYAETGEWRQTYERVRPRLCYFHVKDAYKSPDGRWHNVMLGAGHLPLADVFARLKRDGFDGYLSLEWEKRWEPALAPPEEAFPQYVYKVRSAWDRA